MSVNGHTEGWCGVWGARRLSFRAIMNLPWHHSVGNCLCVTVYRNTLAHIHVAVTN